MTGLVLRAGAWPEVLILTGAAALLGGFGAAFPAAGTTLIVVEEAPRRALTLCNRRVEVRNGMSVNFRGDNPPLPPNGATA